MSDKTKMKLNTSCILTVPIEVYENDFTFIINGKEFKTSRIISDIISPKICHMHSIDPTLNTFSINTKSHGNFSYILQLVNFKDCEIPSNELPFIAEVIEELGNCNIEHTINEISTDLTKDNIFSLIRQHEKCSTFYRQPIEREIEFISENFYELCTNEDEMRNLNVETLYGIINNEHLRLNNEDQLLNLINNLYKFDAKYSILYEAVLFENASKESITEFVTKFELNDITNSIWNKICIRLQQEISSNENTNNERYNYSRFEYQENKEFCGIINYFNNETNGNIENEIKITCSKCTSNNERWQPRNAALFNDQKNYFISSNDENSWLCFDFQHHSIIPTDYTIRSADRGTNDHHPKNWVIEVSNDNEKWNVIDEVNNCSFFKWKESRSHISY